MSTLITDGFDPGDDEKAIAILEKWNGGVISDQLFTAVAGVMPTTGVVVVIIYNRQNPEVLFIHRPSDDPTLPGQFNLPGKLLRNSDFKREDKLPQNGPLERIQTSEIKSSFPGKPEYIGVNLNSDVRGSWAILVYIIEVLNKDEYRGEGEWIKVSEMKKRTDIVQTEINHINIALGRVKQVE